MHNDNLKKFRAWGSYTKGRNAKNGIGSDTILDQEVTPQNSMYIGWRLCMYLYMDLYAMDPQQARLSNPGLTIFKFLL